VNIYKYAICILYTNMQKCMHTYNIYIYKYLYTLCNGKREGQREGGRGREGEREGFGYRPFAPMVTHCTL
jgi:hypothetical protein